MVVVKKIYNLFLAVLSFLLLLLISFVVFPKVHAQNSTVNNTNTKKNFTLDKDTVYNGDLFAAGERVDIEGTVNGDLYIAGGQLFISGQINGNLLAAGGTINLSGNVSQNIRVAGGQIIINGLVGRNASIAGGNIDLAKSAQVTGGLATAFGNLTVSSPVGSYIKGTGGNLTLDSTVGGDTDVALGNLTVTGNGQLSGNLNYWSGQKATIDPSAQIAGTTSFHQNKAATKAEVRSLEKKVFTAGRVGSLFITYLFGLIYLFFFPVHLEKAVTALKEKPFIALLWGLVSPFILLVLVILFAVTIIGIPFALFIVALYFFLLYIARIPVIYLAGRWLLSRFDNRTSVFWSFTFGIIIYWILILIPYIRGLVVILTPVFGFGSFVLASGGRAAKRQSVSAVASRSESSPRKRGRPRRS